jgi:hypothetical protein
MNVPLGTLSAAGARASKVGARVLNDRAYIGRAQSLAEGRHPPEARADERELISLRHSVRNVHQRRTEVAFAVDAMASSTLGAEDEGTLRLAGPA